MTRREVNKTSPPLPKYKYVDPDQTTSARACWALSLLPIQLQEGRTGKVNRAKSAPASHPFKSTSGVQTKQVVVDLTLVPAPHRCQPLHLSDALPDTHPPSPTMSAPSANAPAPAPAPAGAAAPKKKEEEEQLSFGEIMRKASASAVRGGTAGAVAMGANVFALMWMRTTVRCWLDPWPLSLGWDGAAANLSCGQTKK
jgi:hypothetical protein